MKKYLLLCTALTISSSAYALDCATPPTCDDLGYTQSASDCAGQFMLKCPFSDEDFFCGGDTPAGKCINEEYTLNDGANCDTYYKKETCSHDNSYYKCTEMTAAEKCIADGYKYTSCSLGMTAGDTCPHSPLYMICYANFTQLDHCTTGYTEETACNGICSGIVSNGTTSNLGNTCYSCCTPNLSNPTSTCMYCKVEAIQ